MMANKLSLVLLIGLLSSVTLLGCQSISNNALNLDTVDHPVQEDLQALFESSNQESNEYIRSWKLSELPISILNRYDWQLVEWIDNQGTVIKAALDTPLIMDVRPSNLIFTYGCQSYRVDHSNYSDYKYGSYGVKNISAPSCLIDTTSTSDDLSLPQQLQKNSIEEYLQTEFAPYGKSRFSYELLSLSPNTYQLGLKVYDKTLVFEGTAKTIEPIASLPITNDLLKSYQWRLVSAIDSERKTIIELSRPGFPVNAYFGYPMYNNEHQVGFSSNCNGVGGPYTLSADNLLIIGSGPQTLMGCGPKREAAEDKIRALEQSSQSQLTLNQFSDTNVDNTSLPYYLLTQKMVTGETLIWKNSDIVNK